MLNQTSEPIPEVSPAVEQETALEQTKNENPTLEQQLKEAREKAALEGSLTANKNLAKNQNLPNYERPNE